MQLALLRGEPIVAFDLTDEEFDALKVEARADRGTLRFPDGLEAIPRRGTRVHAHFAHKSGEGGGGEAETIHHVAAKKAILEVAVARGWQAQLEARSPEGGWRADVLLARGPRRIAFGSNGLIRTSRTIKIALHATPRTVLRLSGWRSTPHEPGRRSNARSNRFPTNQSR